MNIDIHDKQPKTRDCERAAEVLKALGHPVRLRIVLSLLQDDCNVKRIWQRLKLPQATISQHLAQLKARRIVQARRDGVNVCYTVCDEFAARVARALLKS